jgi:hypothetical protein
MDDQGDGELDDTETGDDVVTGSGSLRLSDGKFDGRQKPIKLTQHFTKGPYIERGVSVPEGNTYFCFVR